uniref:Uncharacterized protein n=1 Tax=viral metagenome TaxID=1070528 RepID=A0A6C0HIH8_9ZZZZ
MSDVDTLKIVPVLKHLGKTKIGFEGFNMSIIVHPTNSSHYLASIRQVETFDHKAYPQTYNRNFILELDHLFQVVSSKEMTEETKRKYNRSYSIGCEDCRLISGSRMTAVTLDTNGEWVPEMSLCDYNYETGEIKKIQPLHFGDEQNEEKTAEKNWLVLKNLERNGSIHLIHSYDPLRIVSVDVHTGYSSLVSMKRVFHVEGCEIHGGACIFLSRKKQYLIAVRVVQNHEYKFSHWLLLNELYTFLGISDRFFFEPYSPKKYEMCMSLTEDESEKKLFAAVSINDKEVYVYEYLIDDILGMILPD